MLSRTRPAGGPKPGDFINKNQKLFFYVEAICNLAIEFNGLVSTKGQQKC
jgi:hypothetical protein